MDMQLSDGMREFLDLCLSLPRDQKQTAMNHFGVLRDSDRPERKHVLPPRLEAELPFITYVIQPERPIEQHCASLGVSEKELKKIIKTGVNKHRDALPPGVADALLQGERPESLVALHFPALTAEGEVVPGKFPFRFTIPGKVYKSRLFLHSGGVFDNGIIEMPTESEKQSTYFAALPQEMGIKRLLVSALVRDLRREHYRRFATTNILSTIGRKWNKVKSIVAMLRQTATFLEGLERINLEHPTADTAFQALQPAPLAVREYMRLKIIELMLDDILDDMGEQIRILAEFPDTKRWLLNHLLSTEILSIENLEKMQGKTQDIKAERVNIGWGECIGKMFDIIRPYVASDGETYRVIKANLEANFPSAPFRVDSIRQSVKRHQKATTTTAG